MWLSRIHQMSVGPLWLLRRVEPVALAPACPSCGRAWLQTDDADLSRLVILAEPLSDGPEQVLLHNCLSAAGWQEAGRFALHQSCDVAESARQALQELVLNHGTAVLLSFGDTGVSLTGAALPPGQATDFHDATMIATHHPRQMLEQPALKAQVWSDLCLAMHHAR